MEPSLNRAVTRVQADRKPQVLKASTPETYRNLCATKLYECLLSLKVQQPPPHGPSSKKSSPSGTKTSVAKGKDNLTKGDNPPTGIQDLSHGPFPPSPTRNKGPSSSAKGAGAKGGGKGIRDASAGLRIEAGTWRLYGVDVPITLDPGKVSEVQ